MWVFNSPTFHLIQHSWSDNRFIKLTVEVLHIIIAQDTWCRPQHVPIFLYYWLRYLKLPLLEMTWMTIHTFTSTLWLMSLSFQSFSVLLILNLKNPLVSKFCLQTTNLSLMLKRVLPINIMSSTNSICHDTSYWIYHTSSSITMLNRDGLGVDPWCNPITTGKYFWVTSYYPHLGLGPIVHVLNRPNVSCWNIFSLQTSP